VIKRLKSYFTLYCITSIISMALFSLSFYQGVAIFADTNFYSSNNLSLIGQNSARTDTIVLGVTLFILASVFLILSIAFSMVLLYFFWDSIREGEKTRITPGKAVGYMFIPFFNLYWSFQAYVGLSADMQSYITEKKISARAPSNVLGIGVVLLSIVLLFSERGLLLLMWVSMALNIVFLYQGYIAVKAIYVVENNILEEK